MAVVFKSASATSRKSRSAGFSLIEFGIVITISGIVMASAIGLYANHVKKQKVEATYERVFSANELMTALWTIRGSYPCPADPNLEPTDPNYGRSSCPASSVTPGNCTRPGLNGVCVSNGLSASGQLKNSHVLTGMLPFVTIMEAYEQQRAELERAYKAATDPSSKEVLRRTLRAAKTVKFSDAYMLSIDGWGNQYSYAVSRALTGNGGADAADSVAAAADVTKKIIGAVQILNETGGEQASSRGVHYAIVSHGENGLGARNRFGVRNNVCNITAGLSVSEVENCDYDQNGSFARPTADFNRDASDDYSDDILIFNTYLAEDVWAKTDCGGPVCLYNKNPGNVAINKDALAGGVIDQKLSVGGRLEANSIMSKALCDRDGQNCFSPSILGGYSMNRCPQTGLPANQRRVATKISNGAIDCSKIVTLPVYSQTCPLAVGGSNGERELIQGYNASGPICVDPCKEDRQERTVNCAGAGMSGTVQVEAFYSCTTRTWSSWGEVPPALNNCALACVPYTESRTQPCPADHTGIINQERTTSCPYSDAVPWTTTSNTCTPAPPQCQRFNLTLRSNCNPNEPLQNIVVSCDGGYYAVSTSMEAAYDSCAPITSPTAAGAQTSAKSSNCRALLNGQTYKTSGCP